MAFHELLLLGGVVLLTATSPSITFAQRPDPYETARRYMVAEYIAPEGVTNPQVLESMRNTPRHEFVRPSDLRLAYHDAALPIGYAQTISPPFIVAYMTQTIDPQPTDTVLEIGTGSGYQAAVLSPLVKEVYSIEIVEQLAKSAAGKLKRLNYENVHTKPGDGYAGWPEAAPFDKIIVTCSPEKVPQPLVDQLAEGGKLLIPLGERYNQTFYLFEKKDGKLQANKLISTLFVPMTGTSEDRREVQPDTAHPQLKNGSFETDADGDGRPDGWHYLRQATLRDGEASHGERSMLIANADVGRLAQVLQGLGIDGRKVAGLDVSAMVRPLEITPHPSYSERPGLTVIYFDDNRRTIGTGFIPLPAVTEEWTKIGRRVTVPITAREAVIVVSLAGGTGRLGLDDLTLVPEPR